MWFLNALKQSGQVLRGIRKISTWITAEGNFQNLIFFSKLLDQRLLIFENGTWVRAEWSSDVELIRRYKIAVDLKVQRFKQQIWFLAFCNELLLVFEMRFWTRPNLFIKYSFKFVGGDKTPLWCEVEEDMIFRKIFWFSETWQCLIVFKCSFWARLDVCFNCSLEFTHWNYFFMDPRNLVSLTLVFIFNVKLVKCRMCKITFRFDFANGWRFQKVIMFSAGII